jgi:hypothetical protein
MDGNPFYRVTLKHAVQNGIKFWRQRQYRPEELRILQERAKGRVLWRGSLPGVATTSEVDEYNTQAPDVIGG